MSGLNPRQLRDLVVRPALAHVGLPGGEVVERLILGTAAHESGGFRYIKQKGGGPAVSLWQIEPATAMDALDRAGEPVRSRIYELTAFGPGKLAGGDPGHVIETLPGNLYLAAGMCRLIYYLKPFRMPTTATPEELARIWKLHWNSLKGKGTEAQFLKAYRAHVAPLYD